MKVDIKVPTSGESVVEATIGAILKPSGSLVKADEELLELETDKLNQVIYSPAAGRVELSVKSGDVVKIGQTIGAIDTSAASAEAPAPAPAKPAPEKPKPEVKKAPPPAPASMPAARKKVDEAIGEMTAQPSLPKAAPQPQPAPRTIGRETRKKMTKLRRVIAERLVQVKNQTAMLTTFNEVDMSGVIAVREKERETFEKKHGIRLGFMSFFIKASVAALQQFPDINGRIEGDEIVYNQFYDISCAVSTDKGLMVPVIRSADTLSYAEIEKKLKELAEKARSGTISIDDLQGGTFTITNAGLFGSLLSTPILNPPQSAILGMHNIVKRAVVIGEKIEIRPMMYLALSYDHRIVDGRDAVLFLMHIKKNLEEPARLLLDL
jgi:2-oxoglutarate dehydrogenase E2 component (dihydrolipoamide succinyltransferase)